MKILRFEADEKTRLGVFLDGRVYDLEAGRLALVRSGDAVFRDREPLWGGLQDVLRNGGWSFDDLRALADLVVRLADQEPGLAAPGPGRVVFSEEEIQYRNPFPEHNRLITCRGLNPNTLRTQSTWDLPAYPTGDLRTRHRLIGHTEPYVLDPDPPGFDSPAWHRLSWNPELAFVISRRGRDIPRSEAGSFVGGYTLFIDGAAPGTPLVATLMGLDPEVCSRFGTDPTYGPWRMDHPIGPWLVTADEIPDPYDIEVTLVDSGTVVDFGYAKSLIFSVEEIVHFFSRYITLEPGDLFTTSAIGFDGLSFQPDYTKVPDPYLEVRCAKIGDLFNPIVDRRHEVHS